MPVRSSARALLMAGTALGAAALVLVGCVPNTPAATVLTVDITDSGCEVSANTTPAGGVRFELTNNGTDANEFYVLADDQARVVGEKEDIAPGQTVSYVVQLDPGTYYTACKFQMAGSLTGVAEFTVTGDDAG